MNAHQIVTGTVGMLDSGVVLQGDCADVMRRIPSHSVDFVLTDPPYITRYRSRDGRRVANDDNARWLTPAFTQMCRLLKNGLFCVSFYGWNNADLFITAWRAAGFRIVGHIVFRKQYASSARFLRYQASPPGSGTSSARPSGSATGKRQGVEKDEGLGR